MRLCDNVVMESFTHSSQNKTILVIKHGALGDLIMSTSAFQAIRKRHPNQHIVLLTSPSFIFFTKKIPYFNEVWLDERPKIWKLKRFYRIIKMINGLHGSKPLDMIYDLQCSSRTALYHRFLFKKTPWFGHVKTCMYPRPFPKGTYHALESLQRHFKHYGTTVKDFPQLQWLQQVSYPKQIPEKFALIVPSCSPLHIEKHWSTTGFSQVIDGLACLGITSVLIGTMQDAPQIKPIIEQCSKQKSLINLMGSSPLDLVFSLAKKAIISVGLDTGPMHLIAAAHQPCITLFGCSKKEALCHPKGKKAYTVTHSPLHSLRATVVMKLIKKKIDDSAL